MTDFLTVGEAAARSGVPVSTLHFYESKGLIRSVRNAGNHRRFPRAELRRIAVIRVAQRAGISLEEIKEELSTLPANRPLSARDWTRLSARWKNSLDKRIERLEALRDQLGDCIGCGCLSIESCPMRNPNDRLAKKGPGPRLIES
jgi:MerR family transcriptional regulator, redox-sensitive transcriptional activator SoxR